MRTFYVLSFDPSYSSNGKNRNDITVNKFKAKDVEQVEECIDESISTNTSLNFIITPSDFSKLSKQLEKAKKYVAEDISKIYGDK